MIKAEDHHLVEDLIRTECAVRTTTIVSVAEDSSLRVSIRNQMRLADRLRTKLGMRVIWTKYIKNLTDNFKEDK